MHYAARSPVACTNVGGQVLYQHDAACRVIARLMRERDEARAMLGAGQGIRAQQTAAAFVAPSGEFTLSAFECPWRRRVTLPRASHGFACKIRLGGGDGG